MNKREVKKIRNRFQVKVKRRILRNNNNLLKIKKRKMNRMTL
jgi:hypothetical protein